MPIFNFLKRIFDPVKLFVDINFGRLLIVDGGKESFVIDHLKILDSVHEVEHVFFFDFGKLQDFVKIVAPIFSGDKAIVVDIDGSEDIKKADLLFNRAFSEYGEQVVHRNIVHLWKDF